MSADTPEYLAWRAFFLGLRLTAHTVGQPLTAVQPKCLRLLGEIAASETTLHNSSADRPQIPNLAEFLTGMKNQSVIADRDLAVAILQGFDRATTVPD